MVAMNWADSSKKNLVIPHAKVVLNLEQQLGRFVLAIRQRVVLENAHPQPVPGRPVLGDGAAPAPPARVQQTFGFEDPQRGADRVVRNIQLRRQPQHAGQRPAPSPGPQARAQVLGTQLGYRQPAQRTRGRN